MSNDLGLRMIDEDYRQELCAQADCLGMESLTEDEQCIVLGITCDE